MQDLVLIASRENRVRFKTFISKLEDEFRIVKPSGFGQKGIHLAIGGDEILSEIKHLGSPNLEEDNRRILYFPWGESVEFAKSLGLKTKRPSLRAFKRCLKLQNFIDIPVMQCNGHRFINMACVGSVANIGEVDDLKLLLGRVDQPYRIVFDVTGNGEIRSFETLGFVVAQGVYGAHGLKLCTSGPCFEDEFEFLSVRSSLRRQAIRSLLELQKSGEELPQDIVSLRTRWLTIKSDIPMPINLDGELFSAPSLTFSRDGGKLRFLLH